MLALGDKVNHLANTGELGLRIFRHQGQVSFRVGARGNSTRDMQCWRCGQYGHVRSECRARAQANLEDGGSTQSRAFYGDSSQVEHDFSMFQ